MTMMIMMLVSASAYLQPNSTTVVLSCDCRCPKNSITIDDGKRLRWPTGSVLAFGTQVRGFKPG